MYIYIYTYVCLYIYLCTYIYVYMYVYIHTYIFISRRRIMLKHYGDDYEGLHARAVLRANERDTEAQTLTVGHLGFSSHVTSQLEPALPGNVASILEHCFGYEYFPAPPCSEQRRSKWGLSSDPRIWLSKTTGAPSREEPDEEEQEWVWNRRESPWSRQKKLDADAATAHQLWEEWESELKYLGAKSDDVRQTLPRAAPVWRKDTLQQKSEGAVIRIGDAFKSEAESVATAREKFPAQCSGEYGAPRAGTAVGCSPGPYAERGKEHGTERGGRGGGEREGTGEKALRGKGTVLGKGKTKQYWWSKYDIKHAED